MSNPFDSLKPDPIRPEINGVANAISILERHKHIPGISEAIKNLYLYCEFVKSYHEQPKFWHEFKTEKGVK